MISEAAFGCVNNTIRLRSGHYFDLADPKPDQFTFRDIAGALSKICRFGGQVPKFYSVAEHCCHCAQQADTDRASVRVQRIALMHDAAEAFIGDVVKPFKVMLAPQYDATERAIEYVIFHRFGLLTGPDDWEQAKRIDREMLIAERRALFSKDNVTWAGENSVRRLDVSFPCWSPAQAEEVFVMHAARIGIRVND